MVWIVSSDSAENVLLFGMTHHDSCVLRMTHPPQMDHTQTYRILYRDIITLK